MNQFGLLMRLMFLTVAPVAPETVRIMGRTTVVFDALGRGRLAACPPSSTQGKKLTKRHTMPAEIINREKRDMV